MKVALKLTLTVVILLSVVVVIAILNLNQLAPWAERQVRERAKERCPTCTFSLDKLSLSWRGLNLEGLGLSAGARGGQRVEALIPNMTVDLKWSALLNRQLVAERLAMQNPKIVFFDGEKTGAGTGTGTNDSSEGFAVNLKRLDIQNAEFSYIRDVKNTHAELHIHDIDAQIQLTSQNILAEFSGRIGGSGRVNVALTSQRPTTPLHIDCDVHVRDQDLADLSRFFKPNAGVELSGQLLKGEGHIEVRGQKLNATLFTEYKDFKLTTHKMYDRNDLQAFFTNVGADIAMRANNKDLPAAQKRESKTLEREGDESIVSFMLRGLKEAAIDVTM
ncbi:MAG: hypothetical protein KF799_06345 [Bdellovibrionales bacterium]|nr:hypothetical protein [Bdellovibrionales bacterium]